MKGDLISRQAVLDIWHTSYSNIRVEDEEIKYKKIAFELPSVENKGEWIPLYPNDPDLISFECKSCGEEQPFKWNFCPNCGADMRGE